MQENNFAARARRAGGVQRLLNLLTVGHSGGSGRRFQFAQRGLSTADQPPRRRQSCRPVHSAVRGDQQAVSSNGMLKTVNPELAALFEIAGCESHGVCASW